MTTEQHLDEEIICFLKSVFSEKEEFAKHIDYLMSTKPDIWNEELRTHIIESGYDGIFESILLNDMFWDNVCTNMMVQYFWHNKIRHYEYTIVERQMIPNLFYDPSYNGHMSLQHNILYRIMHKWNDLFKEEIKMWAQLEFGFYCK